MKALLQTTVLIFITSITYGQSIAGHWNGTLRVQGNQIRIVFHVTKINDQYEATLDSPDQNATDIKVTTVNFSYPNVSFEISGIGAAYEGIVSGKSITGKWTQSGTALFLTLLKKEDSIDKDQRRIE